MREITSLQNDQIKQFVKLHQNSGRKRQQAFFIEGLKQVQEALRDCPDQIQAIYVTDKQRETFDGLNNVTFVSDAVFSKMSLQQQSEGVIAVLSISDGTFHPTERLLLLDGVSDPGNCGTLIRTAEAFGFGVLLTEGSVDVYNPKVVQSAKGSLLRLKPKVIQTEALNQLKTTHRFIGAILDGACPLDEAEVNCPFVLVLGNESHGISDSLRELCDVPVKIEMVGANESLNVAIAGGILMHHFKG